jgi:type II secretory pathway pseudopilin PulG
MAFTLPEIMLAMTLLLLVLGGLISSHIFGLRLMELAKSKLGASDEARTAIAKMMEEIRSAKLIRLGEGNLTSFTEVAPDTLQKGSAVQIYPTTNYNAYVRYFWDSGDRRLKRTTNGMNFVYIVANSISNELVFTSENYAGTTLTNNENNRVIGVTLQFFQLQYPTVKIGPGSLYDFYQLRTKITRRTVANP